MHPRLFTREELEAESTLPEDRRTHNEFISGGTRRAYTPGSRAAQRIDAQLRRPALPDARCGMNARDKTVTRPDESTLGCDSCRILLDGRRDTYANDSVNGMSTLRTFSSLVSL